MVNLPGRSTRNILNRRKKLFTRKRFLVLLGSFTLIGALMLTFSPLHAPKASAAALTDFGCPASLSEGADNDWVKVLQYRLNGLSYNEYFNLPAGFLSTDGQFGQNTYNAVVAFQQQSGLIANGVVGTQTWSMLSLCNIDSAHIPSEDYSGPYCPPSLSYGDDNTFVNALQRFINVATNFGAVSTTSPQSGWYPLSMDGSFGPNTQKGVENFQASNSNISVDGNVGPQTWGAIGMCY